MKAKFSAYGQTEEINFPGLTKKEIYQEFLEWLLEKADASCDFVENSDEVDSNFEFENEVIPGMTDGSMGRTWSQDWE